MGSRDPEQRNIRHLKVKYAGRATKDLRFQDFGLSQPLEMETSAQDAESRALSKLASSVAMLATR